MMMSRCSLSRNKWSHDDYSDIRQVQKDHWRSPTRDTDEGNHPRCTTWTPLRHAGYVAFLPVILKGSFRVWYLENNVRDISVVLWSTFTVMIRGWNKNAEEFPPWNKTGASSWMDIRLTRSFACRQPRDSGPRNWGHFPKIQLLRMLIAIMGSIIQNIIIHGSQ